MLFKNIFLSLYLFSNIETMTLFYSAGFTHQTVAKYLNVKVEIIFEFQNTMNILIIES